MTAPISLNNNSTYENTTFRDLSVTERNLEEIEFYNCILNNVDFSYSTLSNCVFEECIFENCNFSMAKLPECRIANCKVKSCKLVGIEWTLLNTRTAQDFKFSNCDLSYSVFVDMDISDSEYINCKINEAEFSHCKMRNVKFTDSDLTKTRFIKNDLKKADFRGAKNYYFLINENICEKAKFNQPEVLNLLQVFGIDIE